MKGFISGATYRHMKCLDVDIAVIKVQFRGPSYWKLRVAYVLRNGAILGSETVSIKVDQMEHWRRVG